MSANDIQAAEREAEQARAELERAQAQADKLRADAEKAQRRKQDLEDANRRAYSEWIVASFGELSQEVDEEYKRAYQAFVEAAASADFAAIIRCFLDYRGAAIREYYEFRKLQETLGYLNRPTYNGITPPSAPNRPAYDFSEALSRALQAALTGVSAEYEEAMNLELQAAMGGSFPKGVKVPDPALTSVPSVGSV